MKKVLKILGVLLVVCCVLGVVLAALLPKEWKAETSVVIAAPPAEILPYVHRPRRWLNFVERYAQASGRPAEFTYTFEGPEEGAGAGWTSESQGSRVSIRFTSSDPETGVAYEGKIESDEVNDHGVIAFEATPEGTLVVWRDAGTIPFSRGGGLVAGVLGGMLEPFFLGTLEELKKAVEAKEDVPDVR